MATAHTLQHVVCQSHTTCTIGWGLCSTFQTPDTLQSTNFCTIWYWVVLPASYLPPDPMQHCANTWGSPTPLQWLQVNVQMDMCTTENYHKAKQRLHKNLKTTAWHHTAQGDYCCSKSKCPTNISIQKGIQAGTGRVWSCCSGEQFLLGFSNLDVSATSPQHFRANHREIVY